MHKATAQNYQYMYYRNDVNACFSHVGCILRFFFMIGKACVAKKTRFKVESIYIRNSKRFLLDIDYYVRGNQCNFVFGHV